MEEKQINPQKENGYTAIANEIMEAMAKIPCFGFSNGQIVFAILRKTYGWHKKEDQISISQLQEITKLSRRTVIYTLQELEAKKIIIITRNSTNINIIKFNKNYNTWLVQNSAQQVIKNRIKAKLASAKLRTSAKLCKSLVQNSVKDVGSFAPTKETITKETITKERERISPKQKFLKFLEDFKKFKETKIMEGVLLEERNYFISKGIKEDFFINCIYAFEEGWTERTPSGKKQAWELRKTFELRRRLVTWVENAMNWRKFNS